MGDRTVPKPLVEIGDRPVLWHVMMIYAAQGFKDFVLALGYGSDAIKRYFLEYDWRSRDFVLEPGNGGALFLSPNDIAGWRITFADTGQECQRLDDRNIALRPNRRRRHNQVCIVRQCRHFTGLALLDCDWNAALFQCFFQRFCHHGRRGDGSSTGYQYSLFS
jgi:hypothetical protein